MLLKIVTICLLVLIVVLGVRAIELFTQLGRYKRFWNSVNERAIQSGEIDYVALGDSAAQGVGASGPEKGYVGLIKANLEQKQGKRVNTVNLSKSGGKIRDVLDEQLPRFRELNLSDNPVITIEVGANDMIDYDPVRFEREVNQLMSELPVNTIISDIPSFSGSRLSRLEPNIISANKILAQSAKKHKRELVQLYAKTQGNNGLLVFGGDFFHPSNKGYRENWAPLFLERLESPSPN